MTELRWKTVFPSVTTQFHKDLPFNPQSTARLWVELLPSRVSGQIVAGPLGEYQPLGRFEKRLQVQERIREPRSILSGEERKHVLGIMQRGLIRRDLRARPKLRGR